MAETVLAPQLQKSFTMNWKHNRLIALRRCQGKFLKKAFSPGMLTSCLSTPRGQGKSTLAPWLALQILTPGSPLFEAGSENHVVGSSLGQSRRTTFGFLRRMVESLPNFGSDYRVMIIPLWPDSAPENPDGSVLPASGKSAMGLVNARLVIADEPGSWIPADGLLMHDPSYSWDMLIRASNPAFSCGRSPVSLEPLSIRLNRLKNRTIEPVINRLPARGTVTRRQVDFPARNPHRFGPFHGPDSSSVHYPGAQDTRASLCHNRFQSVAP